MNFRAVILVPLYRRLESQSFTDTSSRLGGFINRKITLGIGSKLQICHWSSQVKFTLFPNLGVSDGL